jgi:hypothetical protein
MKAIGLVLLAAAAHAESSAQCHGREVQAGNYLHAAETWAKACEALKAKGLLGAVRHSGEGVFCGYPGLVKEPGAEKAEITAYINKAKAYLNDCRGMQRQKALVPGAIGDCGHPAVVSGWADCAGASAAKPDGANGWAGAWGMPWGQGKVFTGKVDKIQNAEQHSFVLARPGTNAVMLVTMGPKTEAIVDGKQIPKSEGFSHVRAGQTVNVFYEGDWAVRVIFRD